jgi:hypothetical protein
MKFTNSRDKRSPTESSEIFLAKRNAIAIRSRCGRMHGSERRENRLSPDAAQFHDSKVIQQHSDTTPRRLSSTAFNFGDSSPPRSSLAPPTTALTNLTQNGTRHGERRPTVPEFAFSPRGA